VSKLAERQISGYGLPTDKNNNVYMLEFGGNSIGMRNAKSPNEVKIWSTAAPRTRPRRGRLDDQGRLWFAQYGGNAIGMFDPATEQMKEFKLPKAWGNPYDVVPSKGGAEVWTGSMSNDHVSRLDTKSGEITNISCRAPPTSAASSSRRPVRGRCSGSATTTVPRSCGSSRRNKLPPKRRYASRWPACPAICILPGHSRLVIRLILRRAQVHALKEKRNRRIAPVSKDGAAMVRDAAHESAQCG